MSQEYGFYSLDVPQSCGVFVDENNRIFYWPTKTGPGFQVNDDVIQELIVKPNLKITSDIIGIIIFFTFIMSSLWLCLEKLSNIERYFRDIQGFGVFCSGIFYFIFLVVYRRRQKRVVLPGQIILLEAQNFLKVPIERPLPIRIKAMDLIRNKTRWPKTCVAAIFLISLVMIIWGGLDDVPGDRIGELAVGVSTLFLFFRIVFLQLTGRPLAEVRVLHR